MKNFNIQLPFFPGFYESDLLNSDTIYWELNDEYNIESYRDYFGDETLTADDLDLDYDAYKKACIEEFVGAFNANMPNFITNIKFREMTSPRFYNFETDKVWVDVELDDDWKEKVQTFMADNKEWLSNRIKKDWSDRDGFWSFMDNSFAEWYDRFNDEVVDERYLSEIIGYMMYLKNNDIKECLVMDTLENIYVGDFIINTKEQKEN